MSVEGGGLRPALSSSTELSLAEGATASGKAERIYGKLYLGLEEEGVCTAVQLDSMVLLISRPLVSPEALEGMRQALRAAQVTLADLLAGLADIRTQMLHERYDLTPVF